jgi:hypothetical protein
MIIKAYTVVSPSHRVLLEQYMLPSFPNNPNMDMTIKYIPQLCPSGTFYKTGWHETMHKKVDCFIDGIESLRDNELFLFVDTDIVFYRDFYDDLLSEIIDNDIVFQNDITGGCNTGFFIAKKNQIILDLMYEIKTNLHKFDSEQHAMTTYCFNQSQYPKINAVRWKFLPIDKYWTFGVYNKTWDGIEQFNVPNNIVMHHGNWALLDKKQDILEYVKKTQ